LTLLASKNWLKMTGLFVVDVCYSNLRKSWREKIEPLSCLDERFVVKETYFLKIEIFQIDIYSTIE
jgi:hypothetical protein